jgi:sensor histidine kinase YesM
MGRATNGMTVRSQLTRNLLIEALCTWAVLGVIHAVLFYQRLRQRDLEAARLAAELAEARLEALTHQLQPHFVFNTLNSAVTLIGRDPTAAEDMLIGLGEMLHGALDERPVVPLASEVTLVQKYVDIMRRRFGQRLALRTDIADDAAQVLVPRFLLQPLVENSLEHGIAHRAGAGEIRLRATKSNGRVLITVDDDGLGLSSSDASPPFGVGLRNTQRRLRAMYGEGASFAIGRSTLGGASVSITLPAT